MTNEEIANAFLKLSGAKSVDELSEKYYVAYYDMLNDYNGDLDTIYEESNEVERKQFMADLRDSIAKGKRILTHPFFPEGDLTEDVRPILEFESRHSVWYEYNSIT